MNDLAALLERAVASGACDADVARLAHALDETSSAQDIYDALHTIGHAGAKHCRGLVEHYLECEANPMLARISLQVLCQFWGDGQRYASQLLRFMAGVSWDSEGHVRLMAISCAGEMLRRANELTLLRMLLDIYENEGERALLREAAYTALARTAGCPWSALALPGAHLDLVHGIDQNVLDAVREHLSARQS